MSQPNPKLLVATLLGLAVLYAGLFTVFAQDAAAHPTPVAPHWEEAETTDYTELKALMMASRPWEPYAVSQAGPYASKIYFLRRQVP